MRTLIVFVLACMIRMPEHGSVVHLQELDTVPADTHIFKLGKPYTRDLHYDYATLVENFVRRCLYLSVQWTFWFFLYKSAEHFHVHCTL